MFRGEMNSFPIIKANPIREQLETLSTIPPITSSTAQMLGLSGLKQWADSVEDMQWKLLCNADINEAGSA